jgi:hypothetical protein
MVNGARFVTELEARLIYDDKFWQICQPLVYYSFILGRYVEVPVGFQTDFASVPRVPILYYFWGNRCHREAVIHDYLFRKDVYPKVSFDQANRVFLEAMEVRDKNLFIRKGMYLGVCLGSKGSWHKRSIADRLIKEEQYEGINLSGYDFSSDKLRSDTEPKDGCGTS